MKAYLFKQLWITVCILLAAVLVLSASFGFIIKSNSGETEELEGKFTPISFLKTLWELVQVNASAATEQGVANVILYSICALLVAFALIDIVLGCIFSVVISILMIFTYFISKKEFKKEMGSKMFTTGLFAPLLLWISTAIFSFHLSMGFGSGYNVYTKYNSSFNFLITFAVLLTIYGIGNAIISRVCRD